MGLDQYAIMRKPNAKPDEGEKLAYWRKHNRLQGWMERLWSDKGGEGEFNCVELRLELEDIKALAMALKTKALPKTEGFFFGNDSFDANDNYQEYKEYYEKDDLAFIRKARKALKEGYEVYYSCWW
jgi:hypothetical protein